MVSEFKKWGIEIEKVKWLLRPNKDEITPELKNLIVSPKPTYSCGVYMPENGLKLTTGEISCIFKHYLALKDIVDNNYKYSVIMEDNIEFTENIPNRVKTYIEQLNNLYTGWDIIFDSNWKKYTETITTENVYVYPKNIKMSSKDHGGTRCCHFYLLTLECAKKIIKDYLPLNNAPDWRLNDLFREHNIKCYWAEPSIVSVFPHNSTCSS
jgi:GR25 family glycosyltransferase involved in LPS biosynthesis